MPSSTSFRSAGEPGGSRVIVLDSSGIGCWGVETGRVGGLDLASQLPPHLCPLVSGCLFDPAPPTLLCAWQDPESYRDVLAVADVTFLPLDVTSKLHVTARDVARLAAFAPDAPLPAVDTPASAAAAAAAVGQQGAGSQAALLGFVADLWRFLAAQSLNFRQSAGKEILVLHDGAAVGYVLYPMLFGLRRGHAHVETAAGSRARGRTSMDGRVAVSPPPNALVAFTVDTTELVAAFVEDLQSLLEKLP